MSSDRSTSSLALLSVVSEVSFAACGGSEPCLCVSSVVVDVWAVSVSGAVERFVESSPDTRHRRRPFQTV